MFNACYKLTKINFENWNTVNLTSMNGMFYDCMLLTELDLSGFDTTNVTDMTNLFHCASNIKTTLTIKNSNTTYENMFGKNSWHAATSEGAQIILNYTNDTSSLVDNMIASKPANSNVEKGILEV